MSRYLLQPTIVALMIIAVLSLPAWAGSDTIILQSTTSTANAGLYKHLLPAFERSSGIKVRVVAVGTGQALRNGRAGDGDVVLVHATAAEEKFVAEGFGVERFDVMYNDFVIVGPPDDPAKVHGLKDARRAFFRIAEAKAVFVSRGDNSGTHSKERQIWSDAGLDPTGASGQWYRETGSGMGAALNIAVAMGAYVLTDRGTWISFKNKQDHVVHIEGDPTLFNQYGVILVNPKRHKNIKQRAGQAFIDWILSREGQDRIADYRLGGEQLFFPNAKSR